MNRLASIVMILMTLSGAAAASGLSPEETQMLENINSNSQKRKQAAVILGAPAKPKPPATQIAAPSAQKTQVVPYLDNLAALTRKRESEIAPIPTTPAAPKQNSPCAGFQLLLRKDWKDIGFAGCPQDAKKAIGAEIAFADDRANQNRIWSVNGTAALLYNSSADEPSWWNPDFKSFGVYTTVNRTMNSSAALSSANVDKITYGGLATVGYLNREYGGHFLSLRGGGVENNIKNTSSVNFTAEYLPVVNFLYFNKPIQRPFGLPYYLRFEPSVLAQYNEVTGTNQLLDFNNKTTAFRVGPQLAMYFNAYPGGTTIFSRMNASFSYHWAYETYSRSNMTWLTSAVGFNIDDAGHLALAFTYNRGNDEDTGTFTNIYRIGLTGKI